MSHSAHAVLKTAAVALMASLAGTAVANTQNNGSHYDQYVYFGGYYLGADKDRVASRDTDGSYGAQAGYGFRLSERVWLEAMAFGSVIDSNAAGSDLYQRGGGIDLQYAFGQRSEFTPYVLAGLGFTYNDDIGSRNDDFSPYANVGIGFTKSIFGYETLRLRGEVRAIYDDFEAVVARPTGNVKVDGFLDYRAMLGLEMGLGKPREVIREVEKVVVREVPVERVVVQEVQVPAPVPAPVLDSDGDGVPDDRDQCPNTPQGARVDAKGCVIEQTLVMRDITFEFNSARLTTNAQRLMENVVAFLRADANVNITISGHTDNVGSDAYNLRLSRARANEVRDYLIGFGINASRLTALGFGESRPVASNDTVEGRDLNRRVEFRIQPK